MKKQIVGLLLALFLLAGLLPATAMAEEGVSYLDAAGAMQTCTSAIEVTNNDTSWGTAGTTTWYVATGNITIGTEETPQRVTVTGNVHLILADNCTLTISGGIQVTGSNALTIYGQGNGTGKLNASAASGSHFAGIGGNDGASGTITINGGNITATGDGKGSGIGGGAGCGYDAITINGGTVIARGGSVNSSGIGAGEGREIWSTITISGGTVVATGAFLGINASESGTISTGNDGHAVIFASGDDQALNPINNKSSWSGVIFEGDTGKVYGTSVTPSVDFTIPADKTLTIDSGKTLTIPEGVTLTNNGTLNNNGTIINCGTITGTVSGNRPVNVVSAKYLDEKGDEQTYTSAIEVTNSDTSWGTAGTTTWYVATGNIAIDSRVTVSGDVHLILADGCELTVNGGIQVTDSNALTIYGQGNGTGKLNASAARGSGFAGIGGNVYTTGESYPDAGTITINGGNITAIGDGQGSGIGGGSDGVYKAITINGGSVIAQGGNSSLSSGIGAPAGREKSATITISGGTVMATGTIHGINACEGGTISTGNDGHAVISASISGGVQALNPKRETDRSSWSGVIFEENNGQVYGTTVTPTENFTIDSGKTLLIPENTTLNISGISAVNEGSVYVDGTLTGTVSGKVYFPLTVNGGTASTTYDYNSKTYGKAGDIISLTATNTPTAGEELTWSAEPATDISNNSFVMPFNALAVTATISPKTYQIDYQTNGGTINGTYSDSYTYGQGVNLPTDVKKSGYTFAGWYDNKACTGNKITAIGTTETDYKTFYAKWTPKTYTVKFITNGGSAIANKTVSWEDMVLSGITDPVKPGWEFTGWKCADVTVENTTKYNGLVADDGVLEITLVAQWKDIAAPVISGITNGETYCAAQTVTVTDNAAVTSVTVDGTAVTPDANGQFVLNPKEGAQMIVAKDAAGNSTTVAVIVNNGHTGGTATCKKLAVCEICGTSYGSLDTSRHNLQHVAAKEATVTEAGHPEYWICSDCGKTFSDANGKTSLSLAGVLTAKLPPAIIEAAGQSVTAGERKALTFRSNAAFRDFIRVEMDGQTLASANYTYQEGSIIVTLQPAYVASLSAGEHTLGIVSTGGVATTVFPVHGTAPAGSSVSTQNSALNSPPTGDDSPVGVLVVAFLVSGGLLAGAWWINKKKRSGK